MVMSSRPSRFPDRRRWLRSLALGFLTLAFALTGCSGRTAAEPYHRTQPVDLYLYAPPNYQPGTATPLMVALHAAGQDAFDCFKFWRRYADGNGYVLLCPTLPYADERLDRAAGQAVIGQALQTAYAEVSLRGTFFIVGFGEGAALALQYAAQFPQAITAVVAIASPDFPPLTNEAQMPVLLLAPSGNRPAMDAASRYVDQMLSLGVAIRLVELDERGDRLTSDTGRLTAEFLGNALQ